MPARMRASLLATDYDGTLAMEGRVDDATVAALVRWRAAGRALALVTGRTLDDLAEVFPAPPGLAIFEAVVAENGAVLRVGAGAPWLLCSAADPALVRALGEAGVPARAGAAIVGIAAVDVPVARDVVARGGFARAFVLNKRSAMILPPGVDKGTGLARGLAALGRAGAEAIAIGDAENDLPMFGVVGRTAAVANALPALAARADRVTRGAAGDGVRELIDALLAEPPS